MPMILQQLNRNRILPMVGKVKEMMNMVKMSQNPQAMLNQLMMNNPQLKQAMELTQQYGNDPMKALNAVAEQMGIDPNEIMNMLK